MDHKTALRIVSMNREFGPMTSDWDSLVADAQRVIAETDPKPEPEPVMKRWSVTLSVIERITKAREVEVEAESEGDAVNLAWDFAGDVDGDWIEVDSDVESDFADAEEIA